ncbi:mandelate racemase/muconate lactonizing enzyme family protein [Salinicola rhizosphaerae]|uniref:Racemase n=1 Tax=Salinicola rhizosphaerae TaxID=1443141 RepID=A0ABQ3E120_9GAMM|nr:mandelate racemase/muconate lactonizing enzyme family protein [Salinicola rhizosphaerae]GHB17666.1 racemase [Salinicola rhizosphaerae]
MTRITDVQARTISVPLDNPTSFSNRRVLKRDYAVVRVTGDDGISGIGFCYGGNNAGALVTAAVRDLMKPVLVGEDTHRIEGLWQEMYQEGLLHGRTGSVMRAISILDVALWDRNARAANLPLHRFLGASDDESVAAYASGGYYLEGKTPAKLAEEMIGYVDQGFRAVKMKVGREDLAAEEARLAAVREAIGDDVLLMMDANNAWRDLPSALAFMRMAEPYAPYWIEEPFSPDDIDNHRRLAERTPVPVATGEIEAGRWRFKELLEKEAAMVLQTDAAVCGGITEFRRIAATAASFGVEICPHWFHDLHVHLVGSTPNAPYVEFFADDQVLNFRKLIDTQLTFADGRLMLPTAPGLGFGFDEAVLERYAIDAWS